MKIFKDRYDAGETLGAALWGYAGQADLLVLGLPRGGVPVAFEVARRLGAPLDIFVVRKLGLPGYEELAMGAIASGGVRVLNQDIVLKLDVPAEVVDQVAAREAREVARREAEYRGGLPAIDVRGRSVIVVDDGLATGASMRAAVVALRELGPARIVVAVPVASPAACEALLADADEVVCATKPRAFFAVGQFYRDFTPTEDDEVRQLLARSRREQADGDERRDGGARRGAA